MEHENDQRVRAAHVVSRPEGRLYGDIELEVARRSSLARARYRASAERSAERRAEWATWADWLEGRRWVADADGSPVVVRVAGDAEGLPVVAGGEP